MAKTINFRSLIGLKWRWDLLGVDGVALIFGLATTVPSACFFCMATRLRKMLQHLSLPLGVGNGTLLLYRIRGG